MVYIYILYIYIYFGSDLKRRSLSKHFCSSNELMRTFDEYYIIGNNYRKKAKGYEQVYVPTSRQPLIPKKTNVSWR